MSILEFIFGPFKGSPDYIPNNKTYYPKEPHKEILDVTTPSGSRPCRDCKYAWRSGMYSGGIGSGSMFLDMIADEEPCIDYCKRYRDTTCAEAASNPDMCGPDKRLFIRGRNNAPHRIGSYYND